MSDTEDDDVPLFYAPPIPNLSTPPRCHSPVPVALLTIGAASIVHTVASGAPPTCKTTKARPTGTTSATSSTSSTTPTMNDEEKFHFAAKVAVLALGIGFDIGCILGIMCV